MASPRAASAEASASLSVAEARALFPALGETTYFATNGLGLLPQPTRDRLVQAIDALHRRGYAGGLALEAAVEPARASAARLLGAAPEEIGFVRNTGEGLHYAAEALPLAAGDEVLVFAGEYRSVVHAFQGAAHRGVRVRVAPTDGGRVTPERVRAELGERTRVVALSWVRYDNGARCDLAAIGARARDAGAFFVVDAIQGLGVLPLDVRAAGADVLAAGAHKWLLGLSGSGILYLRRELLPALIPTRLGVGSMDDAARTHGAADAYDVRVATGARRVEEGARNGLGIAALGESLDLLARIGGDAIAAQVRAVTEHLCRGWTAAGGRVRCPRAEGEWSGIFLLEPPPGLDVADLHRRLLRARVAIGQREGALWGGAHFYNSLEDADRLLSFL